MKLYSYIVLFFVICIPFQLSAQVKDVKKERKEPIKEAVRDTIKSDSIPGKIPAFLDTLGNDSIKVTATDVKLSDDGLDDEVDYGAKDTSWIEKGSNRIHLFGEAYVNYGTLKLTAGYIVFNFETNEAQAFSIKDEAGKDIQPPTFKDGDQQFTYKELRYNFKTKKGIVTDAITEEGEFYLHGARTKFVSKDSDPEMDEDQIFNSNAIITTCDHEHPHFGIRARKLKVIPNRLAVIGPSILEIAGIPTPLVLPFGFFPLIKGEYSGLIFPSNYEYDQDLGLGFNEVGYYFSINDYMDLRLTGDIYTRGTFRIRARSNYKKRYAYSGSVQLSYASNRIENSLGLQDRRVSFKINLNHNQDRKAHPYRNIGGSINIQTNQYERTNQFDPESQFNNKLTSSFNYKHSLPGTPFKISVGLSHNQDQQTRKVNITFPNIDLNMNTIYPFKSKNRKGPEKWYEKITLKYDASAKNFIKATDTTLFTQQTLDEMQNGVSHRASSSVNFNLLKYFNVSPNINYSEYWYFKTLNKTLDPTLILDSTFIENDLEGNPVYRVDTTFGTVIEELDSGFRTFRNFDMGVSMNTQIFGTKEFSKGWLRGIRHTIKPTIGFTYSPDTRSRYEEMVDTDTRDLENDIETYNPFSGSGFTVPSLTERRMAITYGFTNTFEAKYYSKKDSTEKKLKLFNNIRVSGNYNFAADSLKWSTVSISGNTNLFKGITNFSFNASYDPYIMKDGRRTNELVWDRRRRPLEFRNFTGTFSTSMNVQKIRALFGKDDRNNRNNSDNDRNRGGNRNEKRSFEETSILDVINNFQINHTFQIRRTNNGEIDTTFVGVHSLKLSGSIPLTDSWRVNVRNISYDFLSKSFVYPSFSFERDLHCWNMNFSWTPSRGLYSFFIGVKSNTLNFIKVNYGQNNSANYFR